MRDQDKSDGPARSSEAQPSCSIQEFWNRRTRTHWHRTCGRFKILALKSTATSQDMAYRWRLMLLQNESEHLILGSSIASIGVIIEFS